MNFSYGAQELDYLFTRDPKLGEIIAKVGKIEREVMPDIFSALITSIIAQQISGKAAETVEGRVRSLTGGELTPKALNGLSFDSLRGCGLSAKKVTYIQGAAEAALNKTIDFANLKNLSDEEIITQLTALAGVGRWTAEMLLIFSLCRPDVVSFQDFGIRKGIELLYGTEKLTKKEFNRITEAYHPYATIASFYLWHIANNNLEI